MSYNKFMKKISLPKAHMNTSTGSGDVFHNICSKYNNYLPVVYQGPTNRIERYSIYDAMEQDPIISSTLDTIAEYVSQSNDGNPFKIEYSKQYELPESQTSTIEKALDNWITLNDWKKRIFNIVRELIKYGDVILIKDPETKIFNKCNIYDVLGVIVDENKNPTHYIIRNVDLNVPLKVANSAQNDVATKNLITTISGNFPNTMTNTNNQVQNAPVDDKNIVPVAVENIMHLSLNIDNILVYPFGLSTLEAIYKTYVQKMLVQDCILLYRIKNATEKLVFNIPVGNIPRNKRMQYMERCKNELSQRRMPSKDSDGVFNTIDVAYSSIPFNEDYWLPVDSDGIQPKIEKLAGGQALGEINDLVYWENQLIRGLKVPSSWIPYGPTDGQKTVPTSTSTSVIQEQRFFKYCKRIQNTIIETLDNNFKEFVRKSGITVDVKSFSLSFFPPSSITEITEIELLGQKLNLCNTALSNPYISKQYALKHYLMMTEEEFNENEKLLIQEKQLLLKDKDIEIPLPNEKAVPGLRDINIVKIPETEVSSAQNEITSGLGGVPGGFNDLGGGMEGGNIPDTGMGGETPAGSFPSGGATGNQSSGMNLDNV